MLRSRHSLSKTLFLTGLTAAALIGSPAFADTIEGSLNGKPQTWHVLNQGGASTANFTELSPGMQTVTLQGHVEEKFATRGTLSIGFTLMNGALLTPPEVSYFHTDRFMPSYGNQDTPPHWELSVSEIDGNSAHFVGRYQGALNLQGKPEGDEPQTLELAVDFDVRAIKNDL